MPRKKFESCKAQTPKVEAPKAQTGKAKPRIKTGYASGQRAV
jgi:hypothetical protein